MEHIISDCFSQSDIDSILDYGVKNFHVIENTGINTKYRDLEFSLFWETIYPRISSYLPKEFVIKGGYLNETTNPYFIHSDGARSLDENLLCTVLLPLKLVFSDESKYDPPKNKLFIFDQTSYLATTFRRNVLDAGPLPYYRLAKSQTDYAMMINGFTNKKFDNSRILDLCDHLTADEFFGLTLKTETDWRIGNCIIFHPHNLHTSSNFKKLGILQKTNLVYSLLNK